MIRQSLLRRPAAAPIEPRAALQKAASDAGATQTVLSRVIGRHETYMHRFIHYGVPAALDAADTATLARFLGVDDVELGDRLYWRRDAA